MRIIIYTQSCIAQIFIAIILKTIIIYYVEYKPVYHYVAIGMC